MTSRRESVSRMAFAFAMVSLAGCFGSGGRTGDTSTTDALADAGTDDVVVDPSLEDGLDGLDVEPDVPCVDSDGDGYADAACGGDDCDDTDPSVHPGADDVCLDGRDRDCDGITDGPVLLMADNLVVSEGDARADFTGLVWTGSEYVVAWSETDSVHEPVNRIGRIDAAGGIVTAFDGMRLTNLAWTGSSIGVAWADGSMGIDFVSLDPRAEAVLVSTTIPLDWEVSDVDDLLWIGSAFQVLWPGNYPVAAGSATELFVSAVDTNGVKIASDVVLTDIRSHVDEALTGRAMSAWTGSMTGVAWSVHGSVPGMTGGREQIQFISVDTDGAHGEAVAMTMDSERAGHPSIAWSGSEFGVAWQDYTTWTENNAVFATVDESGSRTGDDVPLESHEHIPLDLVWTDAGFVMLMGEIGEWYLVVVDSGSVTADVPIVSLTGGGPSGARTSWTGSELGLFWIDGTSEPAESYRLLFNRVGFCD